MSGHSNGDFEYYELLESHDLSDEEIEQLWPYVAMVSAHSLVKTAVVVVFFTVLALPFGIGFGLFIAGMGLQSPPLIPWLTIPVGFGVAILVLIYLGVMWYQVYTGHQWIKEIESQLETDPRAVLEDPSNERYLDPDMIESAGQVYPSHVDLDKQRMTQQISGRNVRDTVGEIIGNVGS